jgi:hypothetical protein
MSLTIVSKNLKETSYKFSFQWHMQIDSHISKTGRSVECRSVLEAHMATVLVLLLMVGN